MNVSQPPSPLPDIPQARASARLRRWAGEHKLVVGLAGAFLLALLLLSIVPLPDPNDRSAAAKVSRAVLAAVPRWGGVRFERSDPEALIQASFPDESEAAKGSSRVSTRDYSVARRPGAGEEVPFSEGEVVGRPSVPSARKPYSPASLPKAGASQAQYGGGSPRVAERLESPADPAVRSSGGVLARLKAAGRRFFGRRSTISSELPQAGRPGGRGPLAPAQTQQASDAAVGEAGLGDGALQSSAPGARVPLAGVPNVPPAVSVNKDDKSTGGGFGGGSYGGPPAHHRCYAPGADTAKVRCTAVGCMTRQIREAVMPLLAVSMAAHGVAPTGGGAGGAGGDLLGGMIAKAEEDAVKFATDAEPLRRRAAALGFRCKVAGNCVDLEQCRDFIVDQLGRAISTMRESAAALSAAREPCRTLPTASAGGSADCSVKLQEAANKDRDAARRVGVALFSAVDEKSKKCHSDEPAEKARWDSFWKAFSLDLKPVLALIEKPYCPDRLPCEPRGVSMLQEARRKLRDAANGVDALAADVSGLPSGSGAALRSAAHKVDLAVPLVKAYGDAASVNLFRGVSHADAALASAAPALDAWGAATAAACSAR